MPSSDKQKEKSFYGRVRSRDILDIPKNIPTSEGLKKVHFGRPHQGSKIRYVRSWRRGEERTEPKAPADPERPGYKRRRFLRQSKELKRSLLLISWMH